MQYPYYVTLIFILIIAQDTVITAAHCCDGQSASRVVVVAGEHNLEKVEGFEQVGYLLLELEGLVNKMQTLG